jgi:hypothetical protein
MCTWNICARFLTRPQLLTRRWPLPAGRDLFVPFGGVYLYFRHLNGHETITLAIISKVKVLVLPVSCKRTYGREAAITRHRLYLLVRKTLLPRSRRSQSSKNARVTRSKLSESAIFCRSEAKTP